MDLSSSKSGDEGETEQLIAKALPAPPVIFYEILLPSAFPLPEQPQLPPLPSILFLCQLVMMQDIHHPALNKLRQQLCNWVIRQSSSFKSIQEINHTCCSLIKR